MLHLISTTEDKTFSNHQSSWKRWLQTEISKTFISLNHFFFFNTVADYKFIACSWVHCFYQSHWEEPLLSISLKGYFQWHRVLACKTLETKEVISRKSRKSICHAWGKLIILLPQRWCPKQQSSCSCCHSISSVMPPVYRWIDKNSEACCLPSPPMGISVLLQLSFLKVNEKSWNFLHAFQDI